MTHTPGPYLIRNMSDTTTSHEAFCERYTVEKVTDGLRSVLADIREVTMCPEHGGTAEGMAQLFAAAPALYAALKDALVCINQVMEKTPDLVLSHAHRQLTAALAQADGKEQP